MKGKILAAIIACAVLAGSSGIFAEGKGANDKVPLESPALQYPNSIGIFGSSMEGGGLSYQRWMGSFGYAITLGGSILPSTKAEGSYALTQAGSPDFYAWSYNAELDLAYKLFSSTFAKWLAGDLFAYAMIAHRGSVAAVYVPDPAVPAGGTGTYEAGAYTTVYSLGLGIGYEITLFRHFSIPLQFGYAAEWPVQLAFDLSGGLRYRF
jgi:hypothetical protein